jgi:putative SOS response-associated peptidase YedK
MCNLYSMTSNVEAIRKLFAVTMGDALNLPSFPEIYPKREAPVVRSTEGGRELAMMIWGFPPPAAGRAPVTNVRNLSSPFWRSALSNPERRCLVPVTRFCEWEGEKGSKVKRWFSVPSREVFAFAGVWRPVADGAAYAFLTCEPNEIVGAVHPKAMPVLLAEEDYATWLQGSLAEAGALARPYPSELMAVA